MKKEEIMELWEVCFGDSPEFMDLFFNQVYKDEHALVIEKEGKVVSALQMIPYAMNFYGTEIPVAYIAGVSTLPEERGKGLMGELLNKTFEEMKKRGLDVAILIPAEPWLFDYYSKSGFTELFYYAREVYEVVPAPKPDPEFQLFPSGKFPPEKLFAYFNKKLRERPVSVLHSFPDFLTILQDLQLSGGDLWTAVNRKGEVVGMAFASPDTPENTSVFIKEIFYENEQIKTFLLQATGEHYHTRTVHYRTPVCQQPPIRYGMGRIIHSERLIALWMASHPDSEITKEELQNMDPHQLSAWLFERQTYGAFMSLMLD